ncbi:helix-turn-helix domain-containing protein [Oceanobacillus kimchii]|uniref:helix-turn-helix domain-containing protein n=1 Tax=Oceanobacillus kimchii TaxID=746691 RepID=UPI003B029932
MLENIQSLCIKKGISVAKLERELGFSRGSIYKWDKNSPSVDKLQKVAEFFNVSVDRIMNGFDKSEFSQFVDTIKWNRTLEQFSKDTGVPAAELFDIIYGLDYSQPSLELINKIHSVNDMEFLISRDDLLEAAGHISERESETIRDQKIQMIEEQFEEAGFEVILENEDQYEKIHIDHEAHGTVATMFLHEFIERGESVLEKLKQKYFDEPLTIAAHHDAEEWTEEEREEIERFKEFVRSKRQQQGE